MGEPTLEDIKKSLELKKDERERLARELLEVRQNVASKETKPIVPKDTTESEDQKTIRELKKIIKTAQRTLEQNRIEEERGKARMAALRAELAEIETQTEKDEEGTSAPEISPESEKILLSINQKIKKLEEEITGLKQQRDEKYTASFGTLDLNGPGRWWLQRQGDKLERKINEKRKDKKALEDKRNELFGTAWQVYEDKTKSMQIPEETTPGITREELEQRKLKTRAEWANLKDLVGVKEAARGMSPEELEDGTQLGKVTGENFVGTPEDRYKSIEKQLEETQSEISDLEKRVEGKKEEMKTAGILRRRTLQKEIEELEDLKLRKSEEVLQFNK